MFQKRNKGMVLRWETSRLNHATKVVLQIPRLMRLPGGSPRWWRGGRNGRKN